MTVKQHLDGFRHVLKNTVLLHCPDYNGNDIVIPVGTVWHFQIRGPESGK